MDKYPDGPLSKSHYRIKHPEYIPRIDIRYTYYS